MHLFRSLIVLQCCTYSIHSPFSEGKYPVVVVTQLACIWSDGFVVRLVTFDRKNI